MEHTTGCQSALLRQGSLLRIRAAEGSRVTCVRGMVWLTQQNDPCDRVLSAGETFAFDRPGIALVNALAQDAVLAYPDGLPCEITRAAPGKRASAASLAEEIGRLRSRVDPAALRAMSASARRETIEAEARRMRRQVDWLVWQHARQALTQAMARLLAKSRCLAAQARRIVRIVRKLRRVGAH